MTDGTMEGAMVAVATGGATTPHKEKRDVDPLASGEWPGKINVSLGDRGHASGCMAVEFYDEEKPGGEWDTAVDKMNRFFAERPNRLVVDVQYAVSDEQTGILVLFTKVLSDDELQEFNEMQSEVRAKMDERKRTREASKLKDIEAKAAQEAEQKRLIEVGKRCEQNHGKAIEEKRDAKKKGGKR